MGVLEAAIRPGARVPRSPLLNARHTDPSVAVFPDGGFVVVWTAGPRAGGGRRVIHARLFDRSGTPTSGEFRLTDRGAGSQFADHVVADRDGSFLVAWTEERSPGGRTDVFVRRFNRDGTPRGERILPYEPSLARRNDGILALGARGRFAVAWTEEVPLPPPGDYDNAMGRVFRASGLRNDSEGLPSDSRKPRARAVAVDPRRTGGSTPRGQGSRLT